MQLACLPPAGATARPPPHARPPACPPTSPPPLLLSQATRSKIDVNFDTPLGILGLVAVKLDS